MGRDRILRQSGGDRVEIRVGIDVVIFDFCGQLGGDDCPVEYVVVAVRISWMECWGWIEAVEGDSIGILNEVFQFFSVLVSVAATEVGRGGVDISEDDEGVEILE